MLRETPPPPPAGDLLSCFAKKEGKEGDPASPVGLRPTPLRCSQQAAGAELALRAQTVLACAANTRHDDRYLVASAIRGMKLGEKK